MIKYSQRKQSTCKTTQPKRKEPKKKILKHQHSAQVQRERRHAKRFKILHPFVEKKKEKGMIR